MEVLDEVEQNLDSLVRELRNPALVQGVSKVVAAEEHVELKVSLLDLVLPLLLRELSCLTLHLHFLREQGDLGLSGVGVQAKVGLVASNLEWVGSIGFDDFDSVEFVEDKALDAVEEVRVVLEVGVGDPLLDAQAILEVL